jgi:adenylylsulfate kinase-like enzyme
VTFPASPVLWLCGPSGVGKTAVGWEFFCQLGRAGIAASFVDIDQLGMCYPETAADPGRYRLRTQNLSHVVATFAVAGTGCVSSPASSSPVTAWTLNCSRGWPSRRGGYEAATS